MLTEIAHIIVAFAVAWILFVAIDIIFRLPQTGGVSGAEAIGKEIEKAGGDINGGYMMGNIVCSPDASGGFLLAACGVYIAGIWGGLSAAVLVWIGNRICHDKGYAGTTGAFIATLVIYGFTAYGGFVPEQFIAGMVLAILTIQGISHKYASRILGRIWRLRV
ncbi:hypothetical protein L1994_05670 [Methanomicrobium antiquum]|uniref:Energy-converting hydrogenase A subunit B n=1 Tax=Methanomicrobium antiquum TaxID=487686 RepID=A0AAF0JNY7_9EURY|nr:hypothetical protein [Methanomicrobium antiquum]WFN37871.1 hypothetical protein L1994_05670 [Methanomicrobium antiquum]